MSTSYLVELTDEQKIQILEKAKELLGPNGENWTKSCWWGVKRTPEEMLEWLGEQGYGSYDNLNEVPEDLAQIDSECDYSLGRKELGVATADQANVWCLMGAIEEAAYRLGITEGRDASDRFAEPISLQNLVQSKSEWFNWGVIDVNDNPETTFEDVRGLLDERLAQLRNG